MIIRKITEIDAGQVIQMMRVFYASPAVHSNGSEGIFEADVRNCINENPYLEGYVFDGDEGIMGYAMLSKSFSTEFGKPCIWIEDIYIKAEYRNLGIGKKFLRYMDEKYPGHIIRLEAEEENENAVHVYKQCGFDVLPYLELYKNN